VEDYEYFRKVCYADEQTVVKAVLHVNDGGTDAAVQQGDYEETNQDGETNDHDGREFLFFHFLLLLVVGDWSEKWFSCTIIRA
jgi:hypothetical protein